MAKKALLMILDGWGIGKHDKGDVIFKTPTPYLDYLTAVSAHSTLQTCGEDVGLPKGQMGNSEVTSTSVQVVWYIRTSLRSTRLARAVTS